MILIAGAKCSAAQLHGKDARYITHPLTWMNDECWLDDPEPRAGERQLTQWERRELEEKANRDGPKNSGALAEWTKWQPRGIQPCPQMKCRGISDSLVIGSAIREHGTKLGDSSVDVAFNFSGDPRVADIDRHAADVINAVETADGESPPSKIARFKELATTDVEASTVRASKAATQSKRRKTRFATGRSAAPAPRAEVLRSPPAARLDRCPPRDPNPKRRGVAPRSKAGARLTSLTSSPRCTGRVKAPDTAARWRRPSDPQDASTRPHPLQSPRPYAAPSRVHKSISRHLVPRLPRATRGHQTLLRRSAPANRHRDPRRYPRNLRARSCPRRPGHRSRTRKCPSRAPRRIDRHASAARPRHAPRAQRALQHWRFYYNILWRSPSIIAESG